MRRVSRVSTTAIEFGLESVEIARRLLGVHGGQEHVVALIGEILDEPRRSQGVELMGMHGRNLDEPRVTARFIGRDHGLRRAEREFLAEGLEAHVVAHDGHVAAHEAVDRERADPADILSAADRFAAQMEAPGGEGIAEGLARREGGREHAQHHHAGHAEIAGDLEREHDHRQRRADDGGGKPAHRRDGEERNGLGRRGAAEHEQAAIKLAEHDSEKQRGEEQAAAKS